MKSKRKKASNDKTSNAHYYFIEITQLKLITFYLKCSQSVNSVTKHIPPKHSPSILRVDNLLELSLAIQEVISFVVMFSIHCVKANICVCIFISIGDGCVRPIVRRKLN